MKPKKFTIGIDPDLTVLSMAIIDDKDTLHVVSRNNTSKTKNLSLEYKVHAAVWEIRDLVDEVFTVFRKVGLWDVYIEDQYIARHSKAKPQDIVLLSKIAGAWAMAMANHSIDFHLVLPATWKGNCPKRIQQVRTMRKMEIEYGLMGKSDPYPVPLDRAGLVPAPFKVPNKGDFKDINDSIGLAVYGRSR